MSRTLAGALLVVISAVGFGVMPIFAIYAYAAGLNVQTLLFWRFALASVLLFSLLRIQGRISWPTRKQIVALFVLGSIFYAAQSVLYFSAVRYIAPSLAALVLYTYPVMVAVLAIIIDKEALNAKVVVALGICLAGVVAILGSTNGDVNPVGIMLAFGAAGVYSGYILVGNRLVKHLPPVATSAFVTLFAAGSFLVSGLVTRNLQFHLAAAAWPPLLGLTLFATVMAILTFFAGLERVGSTKASILSTIEPFTTAILSAVVLGQQLTLFQTLGGAAVLAGAILVVLPGRMKNRTSGAVASGDSL